MIKRDYGEIEFEKVAITLLSMNQDAESRKEHENGYGWYYIRPLIEVCQRLTYLFHKKVGAQSYIFPEHDRDYATVVEHVIKSLESDSTNSNELANRAKQYITEARLFVEDLRSNSPVDSCRLEKTARVIGFYAEYKAKMYGIPELYLSWASGVHMYYTV